MQKNKYMTTATIIHIIQGLSLEEQRFVFEQILKLKEENEQKQASFAEVGSDFVERKEITETLGVDVDEAFDKCFDLLSNLYNVDTRVLAEKHSLL